MRGGNQFINEFFGADGNITEMTSPGVSPVGDILAKTNLTLPPTSTTPMTRPPEIDAGFTPTGASDTSDEGDTYTLAEISNIQNLQPRPSYVQPTIVLMEDDAAPTDPSYTGGVGGGFGGGGGGLLDEELEEQDAPRGVSKKRVIIILVISALSLYVLYRVFGKAKK